MNLLKDKLNWFSTTEAAKETTETPQDLPAACVQVQNPNGTKDKDDKNERSSLWKLLSGKLGMDISSGVTLPVWLFEPVTVLQRMCEMLHFAKLLNEAADFDNPLDRLAYVAVFVITGYNGTERYGKPFNPILGETYEFVDDDTGVRFFAEQVSHHPPAAASHAENEKFVYWQESQVKTKFLGNAVDLDTQGKTHIYFPKTRDHFTFSCPTSRVNNLLIGRTWMDHFGEMEIKNLKTKDSCTLSFEKCGWLGRGRYEVNGVIHDNEGKKSHTISGKWSEEIKVKWEYDQGRKPKGSTITVWSRPEVNAYGKYKQTEFATRLNKFDEVYEELLPSSDSRLRLDRRWLDKDDMVEAAAWKHRLEEKQRADKAVRVQNNEDWTPRWFKQIPEENGGLVWVYCGDYWEQRAKKLSQLQNKGKGAVEEPAVEHLSNNIKGLACDFRGYSS